MQSKGFGEPGFAKGERVCDLERNMGVVDSVAEDGMIAVTMDAGGVEYYNQAELAKIIQEPTGESVSDIPEGISESLRRELIRKVTVDKVLEASRTGVEYLKHGFLSTEVASITNISVREALLELGAPEFVQLKDGIYPEVLIKSPVLPTHEGKANTESSDWRQLSIEGVPHLFIRFK